MKTIIDIDHVLEELSLIHISDDVSYQQTMNKIDRMLKEKAPKAMVLSVLVGIILLVCLNISSFPKTQKANDSHWFEEMQLVSNNSIYSEV